MKWALPPALAALAVAAAIVLLSDPEHARQGRDEVTAPAAPRDVRAAVSDRRPEAPPAPSVEPRTTLEVEVVSDRDGRAIADARVETAEGEDALTDERGLAELMIPGARGLSLFATKAGYEPEHYYFRPAEEDAPTIALRPGLAVTGRVTLAQSGAGAVGAHVRVRWSRNRTMTLRTDAQGRFEIPGIEPGGQVELTARHEGCAAVKQPFRAVAGRTHVEILLGRGGSCEGRVLDETGRPVPDARVVVAFELRMARSAEDILRLGPWEGGRTGTGSDGAFVVRGLEGGPHFAVAHTDDFRFGSAAFLVSGDRPTHRCEIVVRPWAHVVLKLLGPDGAPVAGAQAFIRTSGHEATYFEWDPDVPGRCRAGPLAGGSYDVSVSRPGWRTAHRSVDIAEGERCDIEWRLAGGLSLEGVVTDAGGRPVCGARADFEAPTGRAYVHTGADGTFRLRGLGPEEGTLEVEADRAGYLPQTRTVAPGREPLRVRLQRRPRVVGRLDPVPETRLIGAYVGHEDEVLGTNARVGRDGTFAVRWVPANREFWLRLQADAVLPWIYTGLRLAPGEAHDLGVLRPVVAVTLRGLVTDEAGRPLEGVEIDAGTVIEDLMVCGHAKTDGEGRFTVTGLVDVDVLVEADHEAYATRRIEVPRPGSSGPLIVVLRRAGFLELSGAEPDARVHVESRDGGTGYSGNAGRSGRVRVKLAPGRYRVGDRSFDIRADETTKVDLGH